MIFFLLRIFTTAVLSLFSWLSSFIILWPLPPMEPMISSIISWTLLYLSIFSFLFSSLLYMNPFLIFSYSNKYSPNNGKISFNISSFLCSLLSSINFFKELMANSEYLISVKPISNTFLYKFFNMLIFMILFWTYM